MVATRIPAAVVREVSSPPPSVGPGQEPAAFGKTVSLKVPMSPTRSKPILLGQRGYVRLLLHGFYLCLIVTMRDVLCMLL